MGGKQAYGSLRSLCGICLFIAVVSSTYTGAAIAGKYDDAVFIIGNWVGKAHFDKKTRRFNSCTMRALYKSGAEIYFVLNETPKWALGINNKKWNMKVGTQSTATIQIDQTPPVTAPVEVLLKHGFVIRFEERNVLLSQLRRGRVMSVYMNDIQRYELRGTGKAISALIECVSLRKGTISSSKEIARNTLTDKKGFRLESKKRIAVIRLVERYLVKQGIEKFSFLKVSDHPRDLDYDVMWRLPNKDMGGVKIIPGKRKQNIDKLAGKIIAFDAEMCSGEFASIKKLLAKSGTESKRSITTVCRKIKSTKQIQYYLHARKNGSFVKIAQITIATSENSTGGDTPVTRPFVDPDNSIIKSLPN